MFLFVFKPCGRNKGVKPSCQPNIPVAVSVTRPSIAQSPQEARQLRGRAGHSPPLVIDGGEWSTLKATSVTALAMAFQDI